MTLDQLHCFYGQLGAMRRVLDALDSAIERALDEKRAELAATTTLYVQTADQPGELPQVQSTL